MVCCVAFSGTGAVTAQEVSVELSPSEVTAEQGDSFEVDVVALDPQEEITGYNFEVEVDSADVTSFERFEVVNEGDQVLGETNVNDDILKVNGFWDPALESSSEIKIGTLRMEAIGAGNADITFVEGNTQLFGEEGEEYSLRGTSGTSVEIEGEGNETEEDSSTERDESESSDGDEGDRTDNEDGDRGTEEEGSESNEDNGEEDSNTNEDADKSSAEDDESEGTEETGGGETVDEDDDTESDSEGAVDSSDDEEQTEEEDGSDETENEATENESSRTTNDEENQSDNNEAGEEDGSANGEDVEDSEGETNEDSQVAEEENDAEDREETPKTGDEAEDGDETQTQEGGESQEGESEGERLPGFTVILGLISLITYGAWRRV